jgi:hypothetical protein
MGWDINVFHVNFDRLRQVQGCRNERLLEKLAAAYHLDEEEPFEPNDEEEDDQPRLPVRQALRNIIFDTIPDNQPEPAYSDAMQILFPALASGHVGDLRVAAFGITSFFHEVDAALADRGFPGYMSQLVLGGSPLEVRVDFEGALGFLPPADCARFGREYPRHDWSAAAPPLQDTVKDLWQWCSEAAKHGNGLVATGG